MFVTYLNLIANDLVIVSPMTSMSGYISYLQYTAGSSKGNVINGIDENGDRVEEPTVFNDPFKLGNSDPNYTSSKVVKNGTFATADTSGNIVLPIKWTPVVKGSVLVKIGANFVFDKYDASSNTWKLYYSTTAPEREERVDRNGNVVVDPGYPGDEVALTGTILYGTTRDDRFNANNIPAGITFPSADVTTLSITGGTTTFELEYTYKQYCSLIYSDYLAA